MNRDGHIGIALVIYSFMAYIFYLFNQLDNVWYVLPVFLGALWPDLMEPATHYTHRKFWHSKRMLKYMSYTLAGSVVVFMISLLIRPFWLMLLLFSFVLGYISHLLLDGTTSMGLPK